MAEAPRVLGVRPPRVRPNGPKLRGVGPNGPTPKAPPGVPAGVRPNGPKPPGVGPTARQQGRPGAIPAMSQTCQGQDHHCTRGTANAPRLMIFWRHGGGLRPSLWLLLLALAAVLVTDIYINNLHLACPRYCTCNCLPSLRHLSPTSRTTNQQGLQTPSTDTEDLFRHNTKSPRTALRHAFQSLH